MCFYLSTVILHISMMDFEREKREEMVTSVWKKNG
jgi:hypothetical protein